MKKLFIILVLMGCFTTVSHAFLYEITFYDEQQISVLTDKALAQAYIDAKIEEKASAEFHYAAGFSSAKDYNKRKDLLMYIIRLRREMAKREVESEPIDEWLN